MPLTFLFYLDFMQLHCAHLSCQCFSLYFITFLNILILFSSRVDPRQRPPPRFVHARRDHHVFGRIVCCRAHHSRRHAYILRSKVSVLLSSNYIFCIQTHVTYPPRPTLSSCICFIIYRCIQIHRYFDIPRCTRSIMRNLKYYQHHFPCFCLL